MAFEEQFSQISEFAQAKIALEQERTRIKKLDRIAEETRTRQTELFDVQLRQARQQADDNQRKLDMAQLEQKHTADLASAWVAMMGEADQNETLSRKSAGTGSITTRTGSRVEKATLSPSGSVRTTVTRPGFVEPDPLGQAMGEAGWNGEGPVYSAAPVPAQVMVEDYTRRYKVPGASSTAKDAYRKALINAAREAPGAIQIFSQISEAHVKAENMPEQLRLANEHAQYLLDGGASRGRMGAGNVEYANKLFTARNNGWKLVEDTLQAESPEAVDKKWNTSDAAVKTQLGALGDQMSQIIGRLNAGSSIVAALEKARVSLDAKATAQAMLAGGTAFMGIVQGITEGSTGVGVSGAELTAAKRRLVELSQLFQQNAAQLRDQSEARAHDTDVAVGRQGFAAELYGEMFSRTSDPFGSSKTAVDVTRRVYGNVHNVWPRVQATEEFKAYANLPLSATAEEVKSIKDKLLAKYRELLPSEITSDNTLFAHTAGVFNSSADKARQFRLSPLYQVGPPVPDIAAPTSVTPGAVKATGRSSFNDM